MYYLYRNNPGIFWQPAKGWPLHQTQCHALIHLLCSRNSCSCISHIQTGLLQMVYHPHSSITLNKSITLPTSSTTCTDRLPITHCIQFKIPVLTNRALNNQAPSYLTDLLHQHTPFLRNTSSHHLDRSINEPGGVRVVSITATSLYNS